MPRILKCLFWGAVGALAAVTSYRGEQVVTIAITDPKQLAAVEQLNLDVWSRESVLALGGNDVRVNAHQLEQLHKLNITVARTMIAELEALVQLERAAHSNFTAKQADWFDSYHTFDEIVNWYKTLAEQHSSFITFHPQLGQSIEGRSLPYLVVSSNPGRARHVVWLQALQHAREWVSGSTLQYVFNELVTRYAAGDSQIRGLLDQFTIYVVPVVNPDGYSYTWSNTRLWRKNRRRNTDGTYGVDLNRNWDAWWGGEGSSGVPGSDTYRGTAAFSEPETAAVRTQFQQVKPFGAIDYHCYSQLVLRPYGWTNKPNEINTPDEAKLKALGDDMAAAIYKTTGANYISEHSGELYPAGGCADDWFYSKGLATYSYTFELRDTGRYGFVLPPDQIKPTGSENFAAAVQYLATLAAQ